LNFFTTKAVLSKISGSNWSTVLFGLSDVYRYSVVCILYIHMITKIMRRNKSFRLLFQQFVCACIENACLHYTFRQRNATFDIASQ